MAWNVTDSRQTKTRTQHPWRAYVVIAILFAVTLIALVTISTKHNDSDANIVGPVKHRTIVDASYPQDVISNADSVVKKSMPTQHLYKDLTNEEKLAYFRNKYGSNIPDNLKPIVHYLENPSKVTYKSASRPESIFQHRSEREIAAFLLAEPGAWIVRPVVFDAKFDEDFARASASKIDILDEDDGDAKALKIAVIETKKELLQRLQQGETPSKIMTEAAAELYELGKYRNELEKTIREIRLDPTKTSEDVIAFVEAANRMLQQKGIKPIKQPNLLIRNVQLKRNANTTK